MVVASSPARPKLLWGMRAYPYLFYFTLALLFGVVYLFVFYSYSNCFGTLMFGNVPVGFKIPWFDSNIIYCQSLSPPFSGKDRISSIATLLPERTDPLILATPSRLGTPMFECRLRLRGLNGVNRSRTPFLCCAFACFGELFGENWVFWEWSDGYGILIYVAVSWIGS